ncbi:acyl-CoA dehydrogenase family protein [Streptomyces sp. HSG2]|uniref:acyl-CoA dehydrogenase family protein n=1 Tax=Streptomyces sp. HSG2 TaxID=2797167 RepID=UPI001904C132|nr:acyl-CoA dehydrogenase family protein [Streptomyces sp. HSG2]
MPFRLTDDQHSLRRAVRDLLARRWGPEQLRRAAEGPPVLDRELWGALGAMGVFSLRSPRAAGGAGLGLPEATLVFEEIGRALLPGPLVATHLAAGAVPGAASGHTVVTTVTGGSLVEWWEEADALWPVPGGAESEGVRPRAALPDAVALRSVDPSTPLHRVRSGGSGGGLGPEAWPDSVGVLLTAAEQLGSADHCRGLAVQHARTREQFGRPIGAFQAVAHRCAEMLVRTETARVAVYAAAVTGDPVDVAAARLLADEAAVGCARDCLQVFGGMGFTWESEVHLRLKRAWVRARRCGPVERSEEVLAEGLGEGGG